MYNTNAVQDVFSLPYVITILVFALLVIVSMWKIFTKANEEGWKSIIPIYNTITLFKIAGLPGWYFILLFVPIVNIIISFKVYIDLAHKFGKSTGFGVATTLFPIICMPILAFGSAEYNK